MIAVVLSGIGLVKDVPYTGPRKIDTVGAVLSVLGMGGVVLGILVWQEGGESVLAILAVGVVALGSLVYWLARRKRQAKPTLIDPDLFASKVFRFGITQQMLQQIALGGTMIALPIYLQMVLEYNAMQAGLSLAPLSLSMFAVAVVAGKKAGTRNPSGIIRWGFALLAVGIGLVLPVVPRADSGWWLVVPLIIAGSGLGLLVSQLNNYTLAPDLRGAGERGGRRQLRGGILRALVRPRVRRRDPARGAVDHLHVDGRRRARCSSASEQTQVAERPRARRPGDEQHRARRAAGRPTAGHPGRDHPDQHGGTPAGAADRMLIPLLAALTGLTISFRMTRLPQAPPTAPVEAAVWG